MKTFYINLDSAVERRSKFCKTSYTRWRATTREEVPELIDQKMISMYNLPRDSHLGRCGCFVSHTKLLEYIVDQDLHDVLVLEDDAVQVNPLPTSYPRDSIVYVGGFIYNRVMMNEKPPAIIHKQGINLCPPEYRVLGTVAYIIPSPEVALKILNKIYSLTRYRAIDILLGNINIKQYYHYPASFREEGSPSQINSKNKIMTEEYKFLSMKQYKDAKSLRRIDKEEDWEEINERSKT